MGWSRIRVYLVPLKKKLSTYFSVTSPQTEAKLVFVQKQKEKSIFFRNDDCYNSFCDLVKEE